MAPTTVTDRNRMVRHFSCCYRKVARYHSLAVANVNPALEIMARASDGVIMGLSHRECPLHGVQFHPQSFLTECGFPMIENFLKTGPLRSELR